MSFSLPTIFHGVKQTLCALLLALLPLSASQAAKQEVLYFYNWSEYVPAGLLEQFTQETGIKVIYSTYESNETMYAKLKTFKKGGYDLVVPSTYFVDKMRKEKMLQVIDKAQLSNYQHLDPSLLHRSFDPKNDYSIPYIWGATTLGVNTKVMNPNEVASWGDLWSPKYRNKLLLTDDAREVFQIALTTLGFSGNSRNPQEIKAAYQRLRQLMPNVLTFNSDNPGNPFMEGDVDFGTIWNGSSYMVKKSGVPLQLIWPKEGGIFWMDSLAIPANARNISGAHKMINFLLRPDVAAKVAEAVGYPTPNLTARELLPDHVKNDKDLYPDAATIENGEWQEDIGDASELYEYYFQRLKIGM